MSLLPRRGPGRHDQPAPVAVHPGWTLAPTDVTDAPAVREDKPAVTQVPASRWTSHPPMPAQPAPAVQPLPAQPAPAVQPLPEPVAAAVPSPVPAPVTGHVAAAPVAAVTAFPTTPEPPRREPVPVAPSRSWTQDWEAVAATRAPADAPTTLHTAAVAAIDAVFGTAATPAAWTAAPAGFQQQPHPAPLPPQVLGAPAVVEPRVAEPAPATPTLSALERPLTAADTMAETPLAVEVARATLQPTPVPRHAAPAVVTRPVPVEPAPVVLPPSAPVATVAPSVVPPAPQPRPTLPVPPTSAPPRTVVPPAAQRVVEHAMRTAPTTPAPHRSTVRLGFADASVVDLRHDDPIARALHTVADALLSRDRV